MCPTDWMVFHVDPAPLAGWLMFHAQRHLHSPASMTAAERASFGPTIGHVMELLEQATGCERIYMTAFGESFPHLHAHLIPRYPDRPETHAWAIADHYRACNAPGGTFADAAECEAITAKMKALIASNPPPPIATASKL
jgi:diadenosine tetraphosphate (Ap4A) HIT family hydrolase